MNVAIIGSNGFIGSHLTHYISKNTKNKLTLFGRSSVNSLNNNLPYYQIEKLSQKKINELFSGIDLVYYLASGTIPSSSWENPITEVEQNLMPFLKFTEKISKLNIKKIVFVSSAGTIYGPSLKAMKEDSDKNPFSPYGIMKLTIEHFLNFVKIKNNINFDIYRVSNVYGEGQKTSNGLGIINTFIESILTKQQIQIYGDGENIRNYIHVNDVVKLLSSSINSNLSKSQVFNLGSNETLSINKLVDILKTIIPIPFEVKYIKSRNSDNTVIKINNSKILKFNPNFEFLSLKNGITKTYKFIKKSI